MKKTVWIVSLLWLGCVGDDGTEVIGSYAPPDDTAGEGPADGTPEEEDVLEADADESDGSGGDVSEPDSLEPDVSEADVSVEDASEADVSVEDALEADVSVEDALEADVSVEDALEADVSEEDALEADVSEEDVSEADVSEDDASEEEDLIGFGESCQESQECETALCLETDAGKICSSYCDDLECPEGFTCGTNDGEVVPYCQPVEG